MKYPVTMLFYIRIAYIIYPVSLIHSKIIFTKRQVRLLHTGQEQSKNGDPRVFQNKRPCTALYCRSKKMPRGAIRFTHSTVATCRVVGTDHERCQFFCWGGGGKGWAWGRLADISALEQGIFSMLTGGEIPTSPLKFPTSPCPFPHQ